MITIFILDGIINNYIVIDLILIYMYYKKYKYPFLIGLLYDIAYTDTLFLNAFLFKIFILFSLKKETNSLYLIMLISFYHITNYLILLLLGYINFAFLNIINIIINILINIIVILIYDFYHKNKSLA